MNDFDPETVTFQARVIGICMAILIIVGTVYGAVKLVELVKAWLT